MYIDIHKLIEELKVEQEMALKKWGYHRQFNRPNKAAIYLECYDAISACIQRLVFLLKTENEEDR